MRLAKASLYLQLGGPAYFGDVVVGQVVLEVAEVILEIVQGLALGPVIRVSRVFRAVNGAELYRTKPGRTPLRGRAARPGILVQNIFWNGFTGWGCAGWSCRSG